MDLNAIGIGAIIGAGIVTLTNIILYQKNRRYDLSKEQLTKLYNPLNALIGKKYKYLKFLKGNDDKFEKFAIEYYQFFIELQEIYLKNEVYASLALSTAFHTLHHNHEMEYRNYSSKPGDEDVILKNLAVFELQHKVNADGQSEFEQKLEAFIRVVKDDLYQIYHQKPVHRFFK